MKKVISSALIIMITLTMLKFTALGQEETDISQYLDKTLSDMVNQKQVKGAIGSVVSNGTSELCRGYGFADEERGIAADNDDTAFRIGSISKTFVAVAAQQLAQNGKLNMSTSISVYLEADFPKFKYDITMNNLLTHTAGFEDMFSGIAVNDISKAKPLAVSNRKYMPAQVFVPGEVVSYSNYGIALAAYIVERISGQDFYHYAEDNIFKPLGMTKTSFDLDYNGVAISKAYGANGKEKLEPLINLYPEGSVVSTAADMSKYIQWLTDESNKVLSVEAKQQLFEQHFTMSEEFAGMGYTWSRQERNGILYYVKKGETVNFYSRIAIFPEQKTGVFISFNTYVNEEKIDAIMNEVTGLLLGQEQEPKLYTGLQTADISGYYISTRSNFENQEKIMNLVIPSRVIHISGSITKGFSLDGNKLLPIGKNYYSTPMGDLKYVERNGRVYLGNHTATSYVRTNWYESSGVQIFVIGNFIVFSFFMVGLSIISLFRKNRSKANYFLAGLSVIHIALFIDMCLLAYIAISMLSVLKIAAVIRACGILITVTSASGILYTAYLFTKKVFAAPNIVFISWNISSILFCLWMLQVNIL